VNNFAGGDGSNYYASLTTYADAGAAMAGAVSTTPASTYNYNNQPNGTRYIKIVSGSISTPKQIGQTFNFNASYTELVGYIYTCNRGVTSTAVYRNTNTCFFGNQWISGTTTYASNPSQTAPNTTANWVNNGAAYCGGDCIAYQPQIDNNACSSTYGDTQNVLLGNTAPCNYAPNWVNQNYTTCIGCVNYTVYRDLSVCSPTYLNYQVNSTNVGNTAPSNTQCNTSPNYVNDGSNTICSGYDLHQRTIDNNPCSSTYGYTGIGVLIESNSSLCGYTTTNFSGRLSLVGPSEACAGGEYGSISIQVLGTSICNCVEVTSLPSNVWGDMIIANREFWIQQRVGGVFKYRKFRRNGTDNDAAPIEACVDC
jgi:hypothetical protein